MPRAEDVAWLAGFFDGEGSVSILLHKRSGWHEMSMCLGNTSLAAIERASQISEACGCHHSPIKARALPSRRKFYNLRWRSAVAARLLSIMLPHLTVKHRQALLAIEFASGIRRGAHWSMQATAVSERNRREGLRLMVKSEKSA